MVEPPNFRDPTLADDPAFVRLFDCVFGLREPQVRTYLALRRRPGSTASELAAQVEADRPTVARTLTTLRDEGLAVREPRDADGRDEARYRAVPLPEARRRLHEALDEWTASMHDRIDEFGGDGE